MTTRSAMTHTFCVSFSLEGLRMTLWQILGSIPTYGRREPLLQQLSLEPAKQPGIASLSPQRSLSARHCGFSWDTVMMVLRGTGRVRTEPRTHSTVKAAVESRAESSTRTDSEF